ncbi:unnamed protein product [Amoebophrya sp. A120]|nr:unnamed protein product [Amoebophrya sp. A120]|eukprot:GSA120T00004434001.1
MVQAARFSLREIQLDNMKINKKKFDGSYCFNRADSKLLTEVRRELRRSLSQESQMGAAKARNPTKGSRASTNKKARDAEDRDNANAPPPRPSAMMRRSRTSEPDELLPIVKKALKNSGQGDSKSKKRCRGRQDDVDESHTPAPPRRMKSVSFAPGSPETNVYLQKSPTGPPIPAHKLLMRRTRSLEKLNRGEERPGNHSDTATSKAASWTSFRARLIFGWKRAKGARPGRKRSNSRTAIAPASEAHGRDDVYPPADLPDGTTTGGELQRTTSTGSSSGRDSPTEEGSTHATSTSAVDSNSNIPSDNSHSRVFSRSVSFESNLSGGSSGAKANKHETRYEALKRQQREEKATKMSAVCGIM